MSLEPCPRVLVGGTLIDGTGRQPIKDSIVLMQGEYIIAAGKNGKIEVPKGAEVYDVTGAGDTVICSFTLALCGGATMAEAAQIANHAAGIVIREVGTAAVRGADLVAAFEDLEREGAGGEC